MVIRPDRCDGQRDKPRSGPCQNLSRLALPIFQSLESLGNGKSRRAGEARKIDISLATHRGGCRLLAARDFIDSVFEHDQRDVAAPLATIVTRQPRFMSMPPSPLRTSTSRWAWPAPSPDPSGGACPIADGT